MAHRLRNAFWRSYKPKGATCPFPTSKLAEHFKIKMNSWDQTATSPAPTDPQHNIDVTSTSAGLGEIVAALQRNSNTSAGIDGIPMALLKPHMPQLPSKIFAAAFMDLSGAYDCVNRSLLFDKLVNIGVQLHSHHQATQKLV